MHPDPKITALIGLGLIFMAIVGIAIKKREEIAERLRKAARSSRFAMPEQINLGKWIPSLAGLPLVAGGVLLVLYTISTEWPEFTAGYTYHKGPPWWQILLLFAAAGAVSTWAPHKVRKPISYVLFGLLIILVTISSYKSLRYGTRDINVVVAQERATEAERERIAIAKAQALAIQQTPGGSQCANVVHAQHQFGNRPDNTSIFNPEGKCSFDDFNPPPGICFYMQGHRSTEPKGPFGDCPEAIPYNARNVPRDIERIWSSGQPFKADYTLRPRGSRGTAVR